MWLCDAARAADWISLTKFIFARGIDLDALRQGVLIEIEMEGDVPGLRAGYLNVELSL